MSDHLILFLNRRLVLAETHLRSLIKAAMDQRERDDVDSNMTLTTAIENAAAFLRLDEERDAPQEKVAAHEEPAHRPDCPCPRCADYDPNMTRDNIFGDAGRALYRE